MDIRRKAIMKEIKFTTSLTERLDEFLRRELPAKIEYSKNKEISNSKIRRLILAGAVSVNGKNITRPAFELRGRSLVSVRFEAEKFFLRKAA